MKIKEIHEDIVRYLQKDCYCPNEIYDLGGFGYRLYKPDDECHYLGADEHKEGSRVHYVISVDNQILMFIEQKNKIVDAVRFDATENNINLAEDGIKEGKTERRLDEFIKGSQQKSVEEILKIADGIIIS